MRAIAMYSCGSKLLAVPLNTALDCTNSDIKWWADDYSDTFSHTTGKSNVFKYLRVVCIARLVLLHCPA